MRVSTFSTVLAGLVASTAAQSDLDPSVWKNLESLPQSKRTFPEHANNRPVKRQSGWNPPSDLKTPLEEVWKHYESTYGTKGVDDNVNWGFHQIMANKGFLNICVRWDSSKSVTAAQRTKIASKYNEQYQKWFKWLYGYNGFPYDNVKVNVVGWAVKDKSLLQGSTDGLDIYTGLDADGVPMCDIGCARDAHLDGDYSGCKAGADHHFDHSLWLTDGLEGGFGWSWGQQVGTEYMLNNLDSDSVHILLHEMGHTFGLDDFYDWTPTGVTNFIMLAGSSMTITDFDGWMYRNWWYYLSQKNGWATGSSSSSSNSASPVSSTKASATAKATTTKAAATKATTTTTKAAVKTTAAVKPTATSASSGSSGVTISAYGQCGGNNWTGSTACASGLKCIKHNDYYSQCVPA
ncbi:hypothetical protein CEP51_000781 [Fusarium floridanum]|uniref:CBM1 domain-containing protein n=1 Tax=Fusarium floridanum TaxID=1325733 RepID=A0A428SKN9_9HYPO|nr:hypothetical protein CEP51_000781 [Fusarium floridanum]